MGVSDGCVEGDEGEMGRSGRSEVLSSLLYLLEELLDDGKCVWRGLFLCKKLRIFFTFTFTMVTTRFSQRAIGRALLGG